MVLGRGRFSVLLLAIAAIMFCLALVLTPSSKAQNQDNSAVAVAGGDEDCVDFEDEDNGTDTGKDTGTDSSEDTATGTSEDTATGASDGTTEQSQQNGNQEDISAGQQAQDGNQDGQQTQNQDGNQDSKTGDIQQSLQTGNDGDQQSQNQNGNQEDTSADQQAQDGNQDSQQTQDDGEDGDNECVIAKTVPDEPLLPTGAPTKSNAKETTAQKESGDEKQGNSDRDGKQSDRVGEQRKTAGGQKQKSSNEKKTDGKKPEARGEAQKKSDRGSKKLEVRTGSGKKVEIEDRSGKEPRREGTATSPAPKTDLAPRLAATEWTRPSREEVASTDKPRRFAPKPGAEMTLSVRELGLYDVPVTNSNRLEELDKGLVRMPKTSSPWDGGKQRNVYIAGHYLGHPKTASRLVFYNLNELKNGDELVLKDDQGRPYKYRVSEKFAADARDSWVMGQVRNRDMVTLQTCIPPDFGKRLVVRADRVRA